MVYCAVSFSLASCFTAILRRTQSLWSVMFFRLGIAWLFTFGTLRYKSLSLAPSLLKPEILVRSSLNIVAVVLEIYVLSRLTLTNATVLMYTHPLFAAALGAICLEETFGGKQGLLLLLAFAGVIINAQPWLDSSEMGVNARPMMGEPLGICAGLAFSVIVAMLFVWIRWKLKDEPALIVVHHYLLVGTIFAFVVAIANEPNFIVRAVESTQSCLLFAVVGILVFTGEVAGNLAVQLGDVGPVVAMRNIDIVLVFAWQPLMLNEPVTAVGGLGAFVILVATTLLTLVSASGGDEIDKECTKLDCVDDDEEAMINEKQITTDEGPTIEVEPLANSLDDESSEEDTHDSIQVAPLGRTWT